MQQKPYRIAIFASGSGSNAEQLMTYFSTKKEIEVALLVTNRSKAKAVGRALRFDVPALVLKKEDFDEKQAFLLTELHRMEIDGIVLAGFLLKIPTNLIAAFPEKIINIHPSLLPNFGGEGMYGSHVHEAVQKAQATESGITIHLVNEEYDKGEILFQARCAVHANDSPQTIADRVLALEHAHFAEVCANYFAQFTEKIA